MEHLKKGYGDRQPVTVECQATSQACDPSYFSGSGFLDFPGRCGWKVVLQNGQTVITLNSNETQNHAQRIESRAGFLQSWLFFGLIFTVLRIEGGCLLTFDELRHNHGDKHISTEKLPEKLKDWASYEKKNSTRDQSFAHRMTWVSFVLEKARSVVQGVFSASPGESAYKETEHISDELALSLMVIGETFSAVQSRVICKANLAKTLRGWVDVPLKGWGNPAWVIKKMHKGIWCKRTMYLLFQQLDRRAILLLGAYYSHQDSLRWVGNQHNDCTPEACVVVTKEAHHHIECPVTGHGVANIASIPRQNCVKRGLVGPPIADVIQHLRSGDGSRGKSPLVKLKFSVDEPDEVTGLTVADRHTTGDYVTISHVWADGYGNETSNELWSCQLKYISDLLEDMGQRKDHPFWMDTLLIPVKNDEEHLRTESIKQIHSVYKKKRCIVLDLGLVDSPREQQGAECLDAIKILASGWTRRLWTLQEAYLSQELHIAFQKRPGVPSLRKLSELLNTLELQQEEDVSSVVAGLVCDELRRSLMWPSRNSYPSGDCTQTHDDDVLPAAAANSLTRNQIMDAWYAARWRVTRNNAHETAALATLLGIDLSSKIAEAGADNAVVGKRKMDDLMKAFWTTIHKKANAIPAGMVFVPGRKLRHPGFGWAPSTFMCERKLSHQDPLGILAHQQTELRNNGLMIRCPGFRLHHSSAWRQHLFTGTDKRKPHIGYPSLVFPVDSTVSEWYHVEILEEESDGDDRARIVGTRDLAIILPQAPRRGLSEEGFIVALGNYLGEGLNSEEIGEEILGSNIYPAHIVFRVTVRQADPLDGPPFSRDSPCGSIVGAGQLWCVDGLEKRAADMPNGTNGALPATTHLSNQNPVDEKPIDPKFGYSPRDSFLGGLRSRTKDLAGRTKQLIKPHAGSR